MQLWTQLPGKWRKDDIEPFPVMGDDGLLEVLARYGLLKEEDPLPQEPLHLIILTVDETLYMSREAVLFFGTDPNRGFLFLKALIGQVVESIWDPRGKRRWMPSVLHVCNDTVSLYPNESNPQNQRLAIDTSGVMTAQLYAMEDRRTKPNTRYLH